MKTTILLVLLSWGMLGCGNEETTSPVLPAESAPVQTVEFSRQADQELKQIGFVLPTDEVQAPDFTLENLEGERQSLSDFRGRVVFLNFWGVWCYYCRIEMPSIQRLYDRLKDRGFEVVAVNVRDTEKTARDFIRENNHTFTVLLDKEFTATGMYGIRGFPTTFIVDKAGKLRAMYVGTREWDDPAVVKVFEQLLK